MLDHEGINVKFELEPYSRNVPDELLIQDVVEVAANLGRGTVTMQEYELHGKYHPSTLQRRFRSWFNVLKKANLRDSRSPLDITDEELFDNLRNIWTTLGRQPKHDEIHSKAVPSTYSATTYRRRFGTWRKALEAFVKYANEDSTEADGLRTAQTVQLEPPHDQFDSETSHKTKREISDRLRFSILLRDGFRCQSCGRSPISRPGIELHVDHIIPWSKGGESIRENLQTKCSECNLGKGNAFDR
jgi:5-methylcytosine-specific restriction endonuclease McrA